MTTNTRPELTPVLHPDGCQKYADQGATRQGDRLAMKRCGACGSYVVFAKSTKTGKWYLADCFRYEGSDNYFYVKASPHFKTCESNQRRADATAARSDLQTLNDQRAKECETVIQELRSLNLDHDALVVELDARLTALSTKYADETARLEAIIKEG